MTGEARRIAKKRGAKRRIATKRVENKRTRRGKLAERGSKEERKERRGDKSIGRRVGGVRTSSYQIMEYGTEIKGIVSPDFKYYLMVCVLLFDL